MDKQKSSSAKPKKMIVEKTKSKRYFICGTIREIEMSADGGRCRFELNPDEEMRVVRNDMEEHMWLSEDPDEAGNTSAVVCTGKVAGIDFTQYREDFLEMLIAAKVNVVHVRVFAESVSRDDEVSMCALSLM